MKGFCEDLLPENNHPIYRQLSGQLKLSQKWYQIKEQVKVAQVPQQNCPKSSQHPNFQDNETDPSGDQQSESFHQWMNPKRTTYLSFLESSSQLINPLVWYTGFPPSIINLSISPSFTSLAKEAIEPPE